MLILSFAAFPVFCLLSAYALSLLMFYHNQLKRSSFSDCARVSVAEVRRHVPYVAHRDPQNVQSRVCSLSLKMHNLARHFETLYRFPADLSLGRVSRIQGSDIFRHSLIASGHEGENEAATGV